jgi:superfamily II DNA or RNA helicase
MTVNDTAAILPQSNNEPHAHSKRFFRNLKQYIADDQKADILYDHQKDIFHDTAKFLEAGETRGYIEAPTGTGKTVLFVSLAEAFGYKDDKPPKILVVTPTKDLVRQTQGGTRGDKGFAGFAPDLSVGTFYSDTPAGMRGLEAQVTITTYASLPKLAAMPVTIQRQDGTRQTRIVNQINKQFDIIFLDEGHKALGVANRRIIDDITDEKLIIGFTATPEYTASRNLASLLPHLIHRLDLKEAIMLNMLSPVIPVAFSAPTSTAQQFIVGALGEYENKSLKELIYNPLRNHMIIDMAAKLIQAGNTPIIACIPGDNMLHPQRIAEQLSERVLTNPDGTQRLMRAVAVTSSVSAATRQSYYAQLESGDIDALTYIDVLTEGWDSQRANIIINARPTRSLVAARQRMGRILRNKPDGRPAIALDIVDQISASTAPQVSMADIFTLDAVKSGIPIGNVTPQHLEQMTATISQLEADYDAIATVKNIYTQYAALLETLPQLTRGQAQIKQDGKIRTFASAYRLSKRYHIDSFMLEHLRPDVETRQVRSGYEAVDAYDEQQIHENIALLPDNGQRGHGLTVGDNRYVSMSDLLGIIQRKYSELDVPYGAIEAAVRQIATAEHDLYFTKRFRARTHRGVALYTAQTMLEMTKAQLVIELVGKSIKATRPAISKA